MTWPTLAKLAEKSMYDQFQTYLDPGDTEVITHRVLPPDDDWWQTLARTVAVDFDGVIHPYSKGWTGSEPDDEPPVPGAVEFLEQLLADGFNVVIFSTRADHHMGRLGILNWLGTYAPDVYKHLGGWEGKTLLVTHEKPAAVAYVDDRAVVFRPAEGHGWGEAREAIDRLSSGRPHGSGQPAEAPPEEECSYCNHAYPAPVSLHHSEEECAANIAALGPTNG